MSHGLSDSIRIKENGLIFEHSNSVKENSDNPLLSSIHTFVDLFEPFYKIFLSMSA